MITSKWRDVYISSTGLCLSIKLEDGRIWRVYAYMLGSPEHNEVMAETESKSEAEEFFQRQAINMVRAENFKCPMIKFKGEQRQKNMSGDKLSQDKKDSLVSQANEFKGALEK